MPCYSHKEEEEGEESAKAAYNVSVDGEDGFLFIQVKGAGKVPPLPPTGLLQNVTPLVDEGTDAGVGTAGNAAPVFNGPQAGIIQMLFVARSISPPAVIGYD